MAHGSGQPASGGSGGADHQLPERTPADTAPDAAPDASGSMLELRDQVAGVQAQLDEIHSRLDRLESWLEAHEAAHAAPRLVARMRSRAGRARVTIVRRVRRTP